MQTIVQKLRIYLDSIGVSVSAAEKSIKLSNGSLSKPFNANTNIKTDTLEKFLQYFDDINPEWLLTGNGSMLKSEKQPYNELNEPKSIYGKASNNKEGLPLIPIEAMAGFGGGDMQVLEYDCEFFTIPTFKGADFLIQVKGSSMYPKYNSGDIVACKKLTMNDVFFQWNKVYVIDTEQGALIKRIGEGKDEEHVMIVSDNEKYQPFNLPKRKIHAISIVMGVIRLE